jgi:hypothetical protein
MGLRAVGLWMLIVMDVVALPAASVATYQVTRVSFDQRAYLTAPHCSTGGNCIADIPATVVATYETPGDSKAGPDCRVTFRSGLTTLSGWFAGRCTPTPGAAVSVRRWHRLVLGMTTAGKYHVSQDDPTSGLDVAAVVAVITAALAIGLSVLLAFAWRRRRSQPAVHRP